MSGNQIILYPRNPFRINPPNFEELTAKYSYMAEVYGPESDEKPDFDSVVREQKNVYPITKAFMKEYFDMELLLPADEKTQSVPTVINQLLWIEEILQASGQEAVRGLVIGAGAACVHSLLGAKVFKWKLVCTEVDNTKYEYAIMNVANNILSSSIQG